MLRIFLIGLCVLNGLLRQPDAVAASRSLGRNSHPQEAGRAFPAKVENSFQTDAPHRGKSPHARVYLYKVCRPTFNVFLHFFTSVGLTRSPPALIFAMFFMVLD